MYTAKYGGMLLCGLFPPCEFVDPVFVVSDAIKRVKLKHELYLQCLNTKINA